MLDEDKNVFAMKDKIIKLTKTETRLMQVLIKNKNKYVATEDLVNLVDCNSAMAIRRLICSLNKKLKGEYHIKNNRTKGYKITTIYND